MSQGEPDSGTKDIKHSTLEVAAPDEILKVSINDSAVVRVCRIEIDFKEQWINLTASNYNFLTITQRLMQHIMEPPGSRFPPGTVYSRVYVQLAGVLYDFENCLPVTRICRPNKLTDIRFNFQYHHISEIKG